MVGNEKFEDQYQRILNSFPVMHKYTELNLTQTAVMLDKNWPFEAAERCVIDFALHLLGAYRAIDLPKTRAYLSKNDWLVAVKLLATEKF